MGVAKQISVWLYEQSGEPMNYRVRFDAIDRNDIGARNFRLDRLVRRPEATQAAPAGDRR